MRGGVLARGEGGAGVLPLRREVRLDRPASELADCGSRRPRASRGAALLEQGGPFGVGGGLGGQGLSLLIDLRVSRGTAWGGAARWGCASGGAAR